MNYIRHLNAFFSFVRSDKRLTSTNVSLYFALFYYWNFNRFNNPFTIYRENILDLCKLSKNTYHKSIKQLHEAKYIYYHPSPSRFQVVRISIVRLDIEEEHKTKFKQLDLFSNPPLEGVVSPQLTGGGEDASIKIDTAPVPNLIRTDTNFDTGTVANLRHSINQTNNKQNSVQKTHTGIFKKKEIEKSKNVSGTQHSDEFKSPPVGGRFRGGPNGLAGDANLIQEQNPPFSKTQSSRNTYINKQNNKQQGAHNQNIPSLESLSRQSGRLGVGSLIPNITQVEQFFKANNYSTKEAHKFFYYNQGKNWMLTEKLPITDWQSLARKWMLNTKENKKQPMDFDKTIQYLYERYLDGEKINKLLLPEFADHLQLEITAAIKQEAIQRRINQLSGSNETSELNLWKAYMKEDYTDQLLINDKPNLVALIKRIAVSKHFQKLKSQGKNSPLSS